MRKEKITCLYCGYKGVEKGNLDCPVCGASALITHIEDRDKLLHLCRDTHQGGEYQRIDDRIKISRGALGMGIGKILNHEYFHKILDNLAGWLASEEMTAKMVANDIPELSTAWDNFMDYLNKNKKDEFIKAMFELTEKDLEKNFGYWSLEEGNMKNAFRKNIEENELGACL